MKYAAESSTFEPGEAWSADFLSVDIRDQQVDRVSYNEDFCLENEELCIKNEEFCIKNEEFCI